MEITFENLLNEKMKGNLSFYKMSFSSFVSTKKTGYVDNDCILDVPVIIDNSVQGFDCVYNVNCKECGKKI